MFRPYNDAKAQERINDIGKIIDLLKDGNFPELLIQANLMLDNSAYVNDKGAKSVAYNARAKGKLETGDPTGALVDVFESLRIDSKDGDAYTIKAEANYRLNRYGCAIADANIAASLRPLIPDAYVTRLKSYSDMGNVNLALNDAKTIKAIVTSAIFNHHGSKYRKAELFTMRALAHRVLKDCAAEEADRKEAEKLADKPAPAMQKPNLFNAEAERNSMLAEYEANASFAAGVFKNL
jgi:hypothetical protein